ncbi:DUF3870 domain-containing protein [Peribacillus simplex]|uniref:DUF3870 domain-containing protein n=1 Tax=Peribacillus TaxID=2675229 RepID=UPI00315D2474
MDDEKTILVTGYAKVPKALSMFDIHKRVGIVLEINEVTHIIENADVTFIAKLPWDFYKRLMIGYDLSQGVTPLIKTIRQCHESPSRQVIIVALQAVEQRYGDFLKQ